MKVKEEFNLKDSKGKEIPVEYVTPQLTYLDFGYKHMPRGFEGYHIKNSDIAVEKQSDGSSKISGSKDVYQRA